MLNNVSPVTGRRLSDCRIVPGRYSELELRYFFVIEPFINGSTSVPDCNYDAKILEAYIDSKDLSKIKSLTQRPNLINWCRLYVEECKESSEGMPADELIWFVRNRLTKRPRCPITTDFLTYTTKGIYRQFKCRGSSNKSDAVKAKLSKPKTEEHKGKIRETMHLRYGADNIMHTDLGKSRLKQTLKDKYGVEHVTHIPAARKKLKQAAVNRFSNYRETIYDLWADNNSFEPRFSKEEFINSDGGIKNPKWTWLIKKTGDIRQSPVSQYTFNPSAINTSSVEEIIFSFLKKHNIQFTQHYLYSGHKQIDFYLPDYKIGLEINGLYWHSEVYRDKQYHLNKTKECEALGIRLIHLWEDELRNQKFVIFSRLKSILGLLRYKIPARKCTVAEITNAVKASFLRKYHLLGNDAASYRYGLFYKNRLVAVMTFCAPRVALGQRDVTNGIYELSRYAAVSNFRIIGGAGKLLSKFVESRKPEKIFTYSLKTWGSGNMYKQLGFSYISTSKPNYFYIFNQQRYHRFNFRKSELPKKLKKFDVGLSEHQNCLNNNIFRIYDCGSDKFELCFKQ